MSWSTRLSRSPAQEYVARQADRVCSAIYSILYKCNYPVPLGLKLFERCIIPILTYGAELFGACVHDCIEVCLSKFLKKLLGVGKNLQNDALRVWSA